MKEILSWLIGLDNIRLGQDAPLSIRWEAAVPAWVILTVILVTGLAIVLVYWREPVSVARKFGLLAVRLISAGLLLAALCRPSLVLQRNRVEPAYVALVVDQSLSMASKELPGQRGQRTQPSVVSDDASPEPKEVSRLEMAVAALLDADAAALRTLLQNNGIQLIPFASSAEMAGFTAKRESPDRLSALLQNLSPKGVATNLSPALELVLRRGQGRRLAAIVLASDGRLTSTAGLEELLREAADRQTPIYPIAVGTSSREIDLEVSSVRAQSVVFANDIVLVQATVQASGLSEPLECTVQLIDELTSEIIEEKKVGIDSSDRPSNVELAAKPTREGIARYRIRILPVARETFHENNQDAVETQVLADRLKVLYVEGYPRFEYRYLKNALLREKSIELNVLLLDADEHFVQEGTDPVRRFPDSVEELLKYQVVFFGDVDPNSGWLTPVQMNALLEFVSEKGGGFGLLAGERNAPHRFAGTPLERLVPVNIDPQAPGGASPAMRGFKPELTDAGRESRIFRFFGEAEANKQAIQGLPDLFWEARTLGAKPGANVLMEDPLHRTSTGALPIIVMGRYGAGKIFFQASDDTWRWRRHTGELLYDGYWVRVMRELMNSTTVASDRRFVIRTDRRRYPYGASVRAQIELLDPLMVPEDQNTLIVRFMSMESSFSAPVASTTEAQAHRLGAHSSFFEAHWIPGSPGTYSVEVSDFPSIGANRGSSAIITIEKPDLEFRDRNADPQTLARIAAATGGKVLAPDGLASGLAEIRDRSIQIPDDVVDPLWDSRLFLALFVLMISIEWVLRKAFGLL